MFRSGLISSRETPCCRFTFSCNTVGSHLGNSHTTSDSHPFFSELSLSPLVTTSWLRGMEPLPRVTFLILIMSDVCFIPMVPPPPPPRRMSAVLSGQLRPSFHSLRVSGNQKQLAPQRGEFVNQPIPSTKHASSRPILVVRVGKDIPLSP